MKIVRQRSKSYKHEKQPFQVDLEISPELMRKGIDYKKDFVNTDEDENGNTDIFVFSSAVDRAITLEDVKIFKEVTYSSWDEFKEKAFTIWQITLPNNIDNWKEATCTCPSFNEEFMCKHIIGIAN